MSIVLLRDDFSGSGFLVPRIPDTESQGGYTDDFIYTSGTAGTYTNISGGKLLTAMSSFWGAFAPTNGDPQKAYIETRIENNAVNDEMFVGVGCELNTGAGLYCRFRPADFGFPLIQVSLDVNGSPAMTGTTQYDYYTDTTEQSLNFTVRLEVDGLQIRVLIDGVLVIDPMLNAPLDFSDIYLANFTAFGTASGEFTYLEAGNLTEPVVTVEYGYSPLTAMGNFARKINPFGFKGK